MVSNGQSKLTAPSFFTGSDLRLFVLVAPLDFLLEAGEGSDAFSHVVRGK